MIRRRVQSSIALTTALTLYFAAGPPLYSQVVSLDPNFSPSVLTSGLSGPANGVVARCNQGNLDLLVTEFSGGRISKIDPSNGAPSLFASFPQPDEMAANANGDIFTHVFVTSPILRFSSSGTSLPSFPTPGSPIGVAFDPSDNFYVTDRGSIHTFAAGTFVSPTLFASGFGTLEALAVDNGGQVFAANFFGGGVYQVTPGGMTLGSHTLWGAVSSPTGLAIDPITQAVYASNFGSSIFRMTAPGAVSTFATGFSRSIGLGFDPAGNLYANDFGSGTLWKFARAGAGGGCVIQVPVDIRPTSCPNPLNTRERGELPVAILGTATFDATKVDPTTVKLAGVSPLRSALEDVATPFSPFVGKTSCTLDCNTLGADGFLDLTLHFDAQAVVATLGPVTDGQCVVVKLTGNLKPEFGGTAIAGEDVVIIINK